MPARNSSPLKGMKSEDAGIDPSLLERFLLLETQYRKVEVGIFFLFANVASGMPDVCQSSTMLIIVVRFSCKVIIIFWKQDGHFILGIKYAHARTDTNNILPGSFSRWRSWNMDIRHRLILGSITCAHAVAAGKKYTSLPWFFHDHDKNLYGSKISPLLPKLRWKPMKRHLPTFREFPASWFMTRTGYSCMMNFV